MRVRTASKSSEPDAAVTDATPSMGKMRSLLAQIYLMSALEELTDLRKTLRLQGRALDELRQKSCLPPDVVTELLATVQRRDRKLASRLAKLQTGLTKAVRLLTPSDGKPENPR